MNKPAAVAAFVAAFLLPSGLIPQAPSLAIQVDHPTANVSPTLYGLMTEEINYSYDGGIYAELVRDRALGSAWDSIASWPIVARGSSIVSISADESTGPSAANPRSLKVSVSAAAPGSPAGIENGGFWEVEPGKAHVESRAQSPARFVGHKLVDCHHSQPEPQIFLVACGAPGLEIVDARLERAGVASKRHCQFHTSRARSTTSCNFALSSAGVSGLPVKLVANPHCGLIPS